MVEEHSRNFDKRVANAIPMPTKRVSFEGHFSAAVCVLMDEWIRFD